MKKLVLEMYLKHKEYCFGVLLIYTITAITLLSVGRCEPTAYSIHPRSAVYNDRNSALTAGRQRPQVGSIHRRGGGGGEEEEGEEEEGPLGTRDRTTSNSSGGKSGQRLKPRMVSSSDTRFMKGYKPRQSEGDREWVDTSHSPPHGNCSKGEIKHVVQGQFYITGQFEPNIPSHPGYHPEPSVSVKARGGQARIRGHRVGSSAEGWQKLQPVVECGDDAMTLTVRRRRAVQLRLDRANDSSMPLSHLLPQCGYSVQTTWRDLSLVAQYDACHVILEDDSYMLPLLWRGTPVRMSCPVSQIEPQAVGLSFLCCSPYGMTVKIWGLSATEEQRINVRGEWTPLVVLAEQCGYTLDRRDAEIVIAAPFITCGITVKDGKYTLSLQIGKKVFTLSCPVPPLEELPVTHQPLDDSPYQPGGATTPALGSLETFLWAPPFYLAPPYYPLPKYHHNYATPKAHKSYDPADPPPETPKPTFGSQPLPPVDSQSDYLGYYSHQFPLTEPQFSIHSSLSSRGEMEDSRPVYPERRQNQETPVVDLSEKHSASPTGFPAQVETHHFLPPSQQFYSFYHYYQHPRRPLPGKPQEPDPGPQVSRRLSPHNSDFQVPPPHIQQSVNSGQLPPPAPETHPASVHEAPALYAPYPPQPYPYHYRYYFPHMARGEARRLVLLRPNMAPKRNLSSVRSLLVSPELSVHDEHSKHPNTHDPNPDENINPKTYNPEWIKHPFLSDDVKLKLDDNNRRIAMKPPVPQSNPDGPDPVAHPPKPPTTPTPAFSYNPDLYQYYFHPYNGYYQMYYGPEGLLHGDKRVSTPSSKTPDSQHPSYRKHQTTTPPSESVYDTQNAPLHPFYYHLYYQPEDNQELHPRGSEDSDFDHRRMEWFAEAGYPYIPLPLHSPFNSPYSRYFTVQHPYDSVGQPGGEKAEAKLYSGMRDHLQANTYTPSAPPCGLGPVSDFDCSNSLGCCSHTVKDCTVGQYYVFAVPDSVEEPTVVPPPSSEDSNVSCTLQRLTSDHDIYTVPVDGCGVNKHMLGQTAVHLLEVQGIQSHPDSYSVQESSPVRLMVGCSSSPHSPGEVMFYVMDQPPLPPIQPTPPPDHAVQLRIATDESFSSYHPDAHLPLSLMRGKVVYLEARLLDPRDPKLVLLVHSCLAYTLAPYASWMYVYHGCYSHSVSQLLPSPHAHHIRRIMIFDFLSPPPKSSPHTAKEGSPSLEDPEVYFVCLTKVCSPAEGDCNISCVEGSNSFT